MSLKPGRHAFSYSDAWRRNKLEIELDLEKAKNYFIVMNEVGTGSYSTQPGVIIYTRAGQFSLIDEISAKSFIPK